MQEFPFYQFQRDTLDKLAHRNRVALYSGMGTGKTAMATEQMRRYGKEYNLVIVQKSKVSDWIDHIRAYTDYDVIDYTKKDAAIKPGVIVINYELCWRRPELAALTDFTLLLDESSKVQHEKTKQTAFILSLKPSRVILASGTPCNGKYENLYSQIKLLGVKITKTYYWNRYIDYDLIDNVKWINETRVRGKPYRKVNGYQNIDELKENLRISGATFTLSDEVLDLPPCTEQIVKIRNTPEYKKFNKDRVIVINGAEMVGDTTLTKLLRLRQIASVYNEHKIQALSDMLESTEDRVIIFYNFNAEFTLITQLCNKLEKKMSHVNGEGRDLTAYDNDSASVTLVQYQAGAHGLNLQKANRLIMFSLPLSCELFDQAKARIHRLGQGKPCFYWYLITADSVEERIYTALLEGHDYTIALFEEGH